MPTLAEIARRGTDEVDLTDPVQQPRVRDLAEQLLEAGADREALRALGRDASAGIDVRVATKLAASRLELEEADLDGQLDLAVQFAMWGEGRRLLARTDTNPAGEDALAVKLDQLAWLLAVERLCAVEDQGQERKTSLRVPPEAPANLGPRQRFGTHLCRPLSRRTVLTHHCSPRLRERVSFSIAHLARAPVFTTGR